MILYGDVPLALGSAFDQKLTKFMARYQSLPDTHAIAQQSVVAKTLRRTSRTGKSGRPSGVGVAVPNWPPFPEPRINTLIWPTGASRWAYGYFLANTEMLEKIKEKAYGGGGSQTTPLPLEIGDRKHVTLTTNLYLLPPRQITSYVTQTNKPLWLLPLVDERYWWQFIHAGEDFAIADGDSWQEVFDRLKTALGITALGPDFSGNYASPDPVELTRRYENAAVLLDACAMSIGKRVVRQIDGTIEFTSGEAGSEPAAIRRNLAELDDRSKWAQIAGRFEDGRTLSATAGHLPAKVRVTFPRYKNGAALCNDELHSLTFDAPSGSGPTKDGTEWTIHSTHYADFTEADPEVSPSLQEPDNLFELEGLTERIGTDWYNWQKHHYDMTYHGIKLWDFCGYDNYMEWTFGRQVDESQGGDPRENFYIAHSRIQSLPYNFGVSEQLSQGADLKPLEEWQFGKASEAIPPRNQSDECGFGEVTIWTADQTGQMSALSPERIVKAFNWTGGEIDANVLLRISHYRDGIWFITGQDCA